MWATEFEKLGDIKTENRAIVLGMFESCCPLLAIMPQNYIKLKNAVLTAKRGERGMLWLKRYFSEKSVKRQ